MSDGCEFHNLDEGSVEARWVAIAMLDEPASMCACCYGPCRVGSDFCTRCESITTVQVRHLELAPIEGVRRVS